MGVFVIAIVSFVIGIILITMLKTTSPPPPSRRSQFEDPDNLPGFLLDSELFKGKCIEFLEKFRLEYRHSVWANDRELEIAMHDETPVVGGSYLALCIINPLNNQVDGIKVQGFLDTVRGEGASRGILITTGFFTDDAYRTIEEEPVELVDGPSFVSYLKKFGIYEEHG